MSKKKLAVAILEHISESGSLMLSALFPPHSLNTWLNQYYNKYSGARKPKNKQRVSGMLSYLRKQGLITRTGSKKKSEWNITKKGLNYLAQHPQVEFELPKEDGIVRIITFDVPERERKKRDWLRARLLDFNYKCLQKSVWIGKRPFSQDFIGALQNLKLISYVHIVSIDKKGTLSEYFA